MRLYDIQEGQRVYLATSEPQVFTIKEEMVNPYSPRVCARLLSHVVDTGYSIIGWTAMEPAVIKRYTPVPIEDAWSKYSIVYAIQVGSQVVLAYPFIEEESASLITEKGCHQCGRMNDLGVSSCWLCGTANPTA